MNLDFSVLTVNELMEELGKGGCKPGSGSAAALQGMISAKLAKTVIAITNRPKFHDTYKTMLPKMLKMAEEIDSEIFPKLEDLFHKDAYFFNKAIDARKATMIAEKQKDFYEASRLRKLEAEELKMSVTIPLEIGELCTRLSKISLFLFKNAFRDVRGDSHVALGGAVASIAGCLSIVQLNLLSFKINHLEYSREMTEWYDALKSEYESMKVEVDKCVESLQSEVSGKLKLYDAITKFLAVTKKDRIWSDDQLERIANQFHKIVWEHREAIWGNELEDFRQTLDPKTIFERVFDYDFGMFPILENDTDGTECAGFIDQKERQIVLSGHYPDTIQHFTASHELAHVILHNQTVLHRDRPIWGETPIVRSDIEKQSDKLAAFLSMPADEVVKTFTALFSTTKLEVNDNTAFNLNRLSQSEFRKKFQTSRDFAMRVASTEIYAGQAFKSLASQFRVSNIAMARRLEELGLVK